MTHVARESLEVNRNLEAVDADNQQSITHSVLTHEDPPRDVTAQQVDVLFDADDLDAILSDCEEFAEDEILRDLREKRGVLVERLRWIDDQLRTRRELES